MRLITIATLVALAACGDDDAGEASACPSGTTGRVRADGAREARWCVDGDGLAHGPYREAEDGRLVVEGAFARGEPDGAWRWMWPDGDVARFEQGWSAGLEHGDWRERDAAGRLVAEQRYDLGRRCDTWRRWQGDTIVSEIAFTACADLPPLEPTDPGEPATPDWDGATCPEGQRQTVTRDGSTETWCEVDGRRHGPYLRVITGDLGVARTLGRYADGLRDGRWRHWQGSRLRDESHFAAGVLDGAWTRWHPGGALAEEGRYAAGLRAGTWTRYYPNGTVLDSGAYVDDLEDGVWERRATGGAVIARTTWRSGLRDGAAATFYDDGRPECEGAYAEDLRTGPWSCKYPDGGVNEAGSYRRGLRDGAWEGFMLGGDPLYAGAYTDGLPTGPWTIWFTHTGDGTLIAQTGGHADGLRDGPWESRYDTGALAATWTYVADRFHGTFHGYHRDGGDAELGDYVDGAQHGRWTLWFEGGQIGADVGYFFGIRHGRWDLWWSNGQKRMEGDYLDGILQPGARFWDAAGNPVAAEEG